MITSKLSHEVFVILPGKRAYIAAKRLKKAKGSSRVVDVLVYIAPYEFEVAKYYEDAMKILHLHGRTSERDLL